MNNFRTGYKKKFSETQRIFLTKEQIIQAEKKRKQLEALNKQNNSFESLSRNYLKQIRFIKNCVKRKKKLNQNQQEILKKKLRELEKQMSTSLRQESISFEEIEKKRLREGLVLSEELIKSIRLMENDGLISKGFSHDAFRLLDNKGNVRKF
ncbi:MAG: hypothetical protein PHP82_04105 [Candidatus ainarchaeum sp.]|nr:hypothetical protein [Candidatus ainarchaeum sp.]